MRRSGTDLATVDPLGDEELVVSARCCLLRPSGRDIAKDISSRIDEFWIEGNLEDGKENSNLSPKLGHWKTNRARKKLKAELSQNTYKIMKKTRTSPKIQRVRDAYGSRSNAQL